MYIIRCNNIYNFVIFAKHPHPTHFPFLSVVNARTRNGDFNGFGISTLKMVYGKSNNWYWKKEIISITFPGNLKYLNLMQDYFSLLVGQSISSYNITRQFWKHAFNNKFCHASSHAVLASQKGISLNRSLLSITYLQSL